MGKAMHITRASNPLLVCMVMAIVGFSVVPAVRAEDDPRTQIAKLAIKAMENFDALEYEAARKLLDKALEIAAANHIEKDPVVARIHLDLGILSFSGDPKDVEGAKRAFIDAVKIDVNIDIDPVYATAELRDLLDEVRDKYGDFTPKIDCANLTGLDHTLIDSMQAGQDRVFKANVGSDIEASKVVLHYRTSGLPESSPSYREIAMKRAESGCEYTATLPGSSAVEGGVVHYYIAVYDRRGRIAASKGSDGSPNIIDVVAVTGEGDGPPDLTGKAVVQKARFFVAAIPGTGGAFVTGRTEQNDAPVNCCFAPALFHIWLEGGYFLSPRMSVSGAFRLGFPIGANLDMHATAAPAGLIRFRYGMSETGEGLVLTAALGGGVMRQTIKLEDVVNPGMDTDTTAIGPFLLGGGVSYTRSLAGPVRLAAGADVTTGLPVVSKIGTARLNFGIQVDINLGVIVAF